MTISRLPSAVAILFCLAGTAPAAAGPFDGNWSVVIVTELGDCDRAYRYPVQIEDGDISYRGEAGITFSGRVDARGRLSATVRRGDQSASGSGRLSGNSGSGTWSGQSRTGACSGHWNAERRDR